MTVREGAFDSLVRAELERTVTKTDVDDEGRESFRLVGIRLREDGQRLRGRPDLGLLNKG